MRRVTWPLTGGKNSPHFWNPWPQFAYSLRHFQGATTKIKPCYRQKIAFSHYEGYKVYCACAVSRGLFHWLAPSPLKHSRTTVWVCDIQCFCATISHDLVTLTFDLLTLIVCHVQCFSCLTHLPIFIILWLSVTELRVLNIWSHFPLSETVHWACAVSRDLCIGGPPKPHVTIFWPRIAYSLYNFYAATMTLSLIHIWRCRRRG